MNGLDTLIKDDDAALVEITYSNGKVIAYCTVNEDYDEIAVYEGADLDPEVLGAIDAEGIVAPSDGSAATYSRRA